MTYAACPRAEVTAAIHCTHHQRGVRPSLGLVLLQLLLDPEVHRQVVVVDAQPAAGGTAGVKDRMAAASGAQRLGFIKRSIWQDGGEAAALAGRRVCMWAVLSAAAPSLGSPAAAQQEERFPLEWYQGCDAW